MIQAYADDNLIYDSRLEDYGLLELTATTGASISGTATIKMPAGHPAYNLFTSYRTVVTIYRDKELVFRGRALYPSDDFYNRRTITCEGERGFLRDGVIRPYVYQDAPDAIFTHVIGLYNAQVEPFKQFVVGTVTVTDANNYIRLEHESAEQVSETIDKLVERCGGYIVYTTNAAGERVINWLEDPGYQSAQIIEFGENLLDFARTDENTDLATVVIPYGAKDEETGQRVTVESINGGVDFIQDDDAVALRGVVARAVYWDDVTLPENLLRKAQQYLATSKNMVTALELSAVDLHDMDKDIETFTVGDYVRVRSRPHGVDDLFRLEERTYDLLNPANGKVTLGKSVSTLTGADAAGDRKGITDLQQVTRNIRADYVLDAAAMIEEARLTMTSLIQQLADEIRLEVSETYATGNDLESLVSTRFSQLSDSFTFQFDTIQAFVDANDADAREQFSRLSSYIRFEDGHIYIGEEGSELELVQQPDRISFMDDGAEVAYLSNKRLVVTDAQFLQSLQIGSFAFVPRANGNLSLVKVGG